jgi:hypothetical protein
MKNMRSNPTFRRILQFGGIAAGVIMIAFGAASIYLGFAGRSTIGESLGNEFIVGSDDMNQSAIGQEINTIIRPSQENIAAERKKAGVEPIEFTPVVAPKCDVAGEEIDNGTDARCFAEYLRLHALRSTSGLTYSQIGRYVAKDDAPPEETDFAGGTESGAYAELNPKTSQPLDNPDRDLWVTATALSSALNLAYTAEQVSLFGIVVGFALLLTGIGLVILAVEALPPRKGGDAGGEKPTDVEAAPAQ